MGRQRATRSTFGGFLLLGGRAATSSAASGCSSPASPLFTGASLLNGLRRPSEFLIVLPRAAGARRRAGLAGRALDHHDHVRRGRERTKAIGVWAAIAAGGGAVGLLLGGILIETLSWHWIFFVNVPVGDRRVPRLRCADVPESRDEHGRQALRPRRRGAPSPPACSRSSTRSSRRRSYGWGSAHTLGLGRLSRRAAGRVRRRRAPLAEPLVRLSIFRVRSLRAANVVHAARRLRHLRACSSSTRSTSSRCSASRRSRPGSRSCPSPPGS